MAVAALEPIPGKVRRELKVGPPGWSLGEAGHYLVANVEAIGFGVAKITNLLSDRFGVEEWEAIEAELIRNGFACVTYERHDIDGVIRTRTVRLRKRERPTR